MDGRYVKLYRLTSPRFLLKAQALFCSHLKRGFPVHLHDLAQLSFQESVISWRRMVRNGFPLQRVQLLLHSSQSLSFSAGCGQALHVSPLRRCPDKFFMRRNWTKQKNKKQNHAQPESTDKKNKWLKKPEIKLQKRSDTRTRTGFVDGLERSRGLLLDRLLLCSPSENIQQIKAMLTTQSIQLALGLLELSTGGD